MKLEDLVKEILQNKILIVGVGLTENDKFYYDVAGFSKSGTAKIYQYKDYIRCETRYNTIDDIYSFEDLAKVAMRWNQGYCDRNPFDWDSNWLPVFEKFGWVETKIVKKVIVKNNLA